MYMGGWMKIIFLRLDIENIDFRFKVDLLSIDYFSDHYKEKIGD